MASVVWKKVIKSCVRQSVTGAIIYPCRTLPVTHASLVVTRYNSSNSEVRKGALDSRFLDKKVALVTGSTSGIGLGIARALAARGSRILLNGFADEQLIKTLQAEFTSVYKTTADYIPVDLSKESGIVAYVQELSKLYPHGVDILVNNAGFQHVSPIEKFPADKWSSLLAVLLSAPFYLIRHLLPDMRQRGWGRILNLASVHSVRASPFKAAYVSAKHGIAGLTKVVALETAGSGVTCNAVSPGYVDTPILQMQVKMLAEEERIDYNAAKARFLSAYHPSRDAIGIDEVAEMMVFLCSDAASQITGSNIIMDGGWCAK